MYNATVEYLHDGLLTIAGKLSEVKLLHIVCWYEGRSINKLQNGIILLIFKIWKIWNIGFVRNLTVSTTCEFYYNDITVV